MGYYVYILRCADDTYYTGSTNHPDKRLQVHNQKLGAKYTRSRTPVTMVYLEKLDDKSQALKREYQIKQLTRRQKEQLIEAEKKSDEV